MALHFQIIGSPPLSFPSKNKARPIGWAYYIEKKENILNTRQSILDHIREIPEITVLLIGGEINGDRAIARIFTNGFQPGFSPLLQRDFVFPAWLDRWLASGK